VRIRAAPPLSSILGAAGPVGGVAASILGRGARPVRAILFNKSEARNWALGWHQDRTIVVRHRREVTGYDRWTMKDGLIQVEPPFDILERMVTLRVHLDPVDPDNAPLRILPGSHRLGRLTDAAVDEVAARSAEYRCLAKRGDIWAYATPIVHGSAAAIVPRRRRVLQIDYSPDDSPGELLAWRGLDE